MTRPDGWYDVTKGQSLERILVVHGRVLFHQSKNEYLRMLGPCVPRGPRNDLPRFPSVRISEPPPDPEGWTWRRLE